ncbi:MAG: DUF1822 family protein, partial [Cyanobacteriota bacterium]|nr:DUF1822 family protein [Cyanobacteriota bacterium]
QNLTSSLESMGIFKLGNVNIGVITVEQVLDEVIAFPKEILAQPEQMANFYAIAEVLEEDEEIIFRGAISQEKLLHYIERQSYNYCSSSAETEAFVPLDEFEITPNHLLYYCQFIQSELLSKSAQILPKPILEPVQFPWMSENIFLHSPTNLPTHSSPTDGLLNSCTQISGWFQDIFESAWKPLEELVSSELTLAYRTRSVQQGVQRGKLINLGMELNHRRFMILMTVTAESDEKRRVLAQLHPTGGEEYLPPSVQLTLQSKTGKIHQEVVSRSYDNYIQLSPFKGKSGKQFSIEVSWNETRIREEFRF